MMKATNAPRSLYVRRSVAHVCFGGKLFGLPTDDTKLDASRPVRCTRVGNDSLVRVSQLTSIGGSIGWKSEIWMKVKFS